MSILRIPLTAVALLAFSAPAFAGPKLGDCPLLPADNIWNTPIDSAPVHPRSAAYVASIGADTGFHADFGSGLWQGGPIGIPYVEVPGAQPPVRVFFRYRAESDPGPYPIPPDAPIEGGDRSRGDRHVLVVDDTACELFETWRSFPLVRNALWVAGSGARFDLRSNALRPDGWTSADAAGLPILPGLVRYDEVASGKIEHALRFTASTTRDAYVWPARHAASSATDPTWPPMGQRFRLKASFDISSFSPEIRVILAAMQIYGIILADNGSDWFLSGAPDDRWDDDMLRELGQVRGADMEAVDVSGYAVDPDSGQAVIP